MKKVMSNIILHFQSKDNQLKLVDHNQLHIEVLM